MMGRELRLARPSGYVPPPGGDPSAGGGASAATTAAAPIAPGATAAAAVSGVANLMSGGVVDNVKARKLYVGNLPLEMNVQETTMQDFFNTAMNAAFPDLKKPGDPDPVESVWVSAEKKFCFVTFRTEEMAVSGLQLDNIQLMGRPLRIGRPSDYVPTASTSQEPSSQSAAPPSSNASSSQATQATAVVRLANAVTAEDVDDAEEYDDILDDMKEECSKFGTLEGIQMPKEGPGKTMVYIKYATTADAEKASLNLHGRSFESRKVEASYYDASKYDAGVFE